MECSAAALAERFTQTSPSGFIVFEGINGAGKSTLIRSVEAFFQERSQTIVSTREPGGTPLGDRLREVLLEQPILPRTPISELLLFSASRNQLVSDVIQPALANGQVVLCDRYHYSTTAFQGFGRGLDFGELESLRRIATGGLEPDFVVLLDLDPREGLARNADASKGSDAFEDEELRFHDDVRQGFRAIAKEVDTPFVILDASQSADEVFVELLPYLELLESSLRKP